MSRKHDLVIYSIKVLGRKCHFKELYNYINNSKTDTFGMTFQELRGAITAIPEIHRDGEILELVE